MLLKDFFFKHLRMKIYYLPLLCDPKCQICFLQLFQTLGIHYILTLSNEAAWTASRKPSISIHKLPLLLVYCPHYYWAQFLALTLSRIVGISRFAMWFVNWFAQIVTSSCSIQRLGLSHETFSLVFASWHLTAGKSSLPYLSANEHD